jgi:signal transduction histidine kinase
VIEAHHYEFRTLTESDWSVLENRLAGGLSQWANTLARSAIVEERNRLAREIHDTVAQEFSGILLHLAAVDSLEGGGADRQTASECLTRVRELAKAGLEDTRRMLLGLRPKSLEGAHLPGALAQLASRFARDCGIGCEFSERGLAQILPEGTEDELFRVAQEALCNVQKHSCARASSIMLCYTSTGVELVIKDNGQGIATAQRWEGGHGFGMPTMRDRAHRLGGVFEINSTPGAGTELRITVPIRGKTSMKRSSHEDHIDANHRSPENPSPSR